MRLFAPAARSYGSQPCCFHDATPEQRRTAIGEGGCGPGGFGDKLVPDKILWLSVKPSCQIHDWCYHYGETLADKEMADRIFLNNMLRQIWPAKSRWRIPRMLLAYGYYKAVKCFGARAFWSGKNKVGEMRGVVIET